MSSLYTEIANKMQSDPMGDAWADDEIAKFRLDLEAQECCCQDSCVALLVCIVHADVSSSGPSFERFEEVYKLVAYGRKAVGVI